MAAKFNRRSLLKLGAYGAAGAFGLEQLGGVPLLGDMIDKWPHSRFATWAGVNPLDAYEMMGFTWRSGLGVSQAMAEGQEGWALVQIKVCNHLFTPLVFKAGLLNADNTVSTAADVPPTARCTRTTVALHSSTHYSAAARRSYHSSSVLTVTRRSSSRGKMRSSDHARSSDAKIERFSYGP